LQKCDSRECGRAGLYPKNLKVYYRSGTTNAAFTDENCLLVNPNMIQMMEVISENEESFRNIIYHEVQHMFQRDCPCRKKQAYEQTGFCRREREASINPYYWLWVIEGCGVEREVLYGMFMAHAILHEEPDGDVQCNASLAWLSEEEKQYVLGRALSETVEYTQPICSMELAGEQ